MSPSYFRRRAAQSYRGARSSPTPHLDYEALMRIGHAFKVKAVLAAERLARLQKTVLRTKESERRVTYRDGRE
jgi:hypothetical protein